jgi:hypothetical protein
MNRRSVLLLTVIFLTLSSIQSYSGPADNLDSKLPELKDYKNIFEFVGALFQRANAFADSIDRDRLASYLETLKDTFAAIVDDKRDLAKLLSDTSADRGKIRQAADKLRMAVESAGRNLGRVPFQFGQELTKEGARLGAQLRKTFGEKDSWLTSLQPAIFRNSAAEIAAYAEKARVSADALDAQNVQLIDLIASLRHSQ